MVLKKRRTNAEEKRKENARNVKTIKYYIIQKSFCLKILFLMFSASLIFAASHL